MMKLMQTRRDFLKMTGKVALGGAAVAAAPALVTTDSQKKSSRSIRTPSSLVV